MTATWNLVNLAKNNVYKIYSVSSELDKVVLVTPNKLLSVSENGELTTLQKVGFVFGGTYKPAKNLTYAGSGNTLNVNAIGSYKPYDNLGTVPTEHMVTDEDNILSITDKLSICYVRDGKREWFEIPGFSDWNNNFFSGAVLKGSKLYWLNAWGASNYYKYAKESEKPERAKQAKNVVFEIDLLTKTAKDITEDLSCLNMLGQPFGIVGSLTSNASKTVLYVSTEQGIWQRKIDSTGWEMIYPGWGNYKLCSQPDDSLIAVQSSADKRQHSFSLYKDGRWVKLENFESSVELIVGSVVKRNNYIYLHLFEESTKKGYLATLDISEVKPETYQNPKIAAYLNIADPVCSKIVSHTQQLAIATKDSVFSVDQATGKVDKVLSVDTNEYGKILDIHPIKNGCLVATSTDLLEYKFLDANPLTILATGSTSNNSRVIEDNEVVYYLSGKQITVLNQFTGESAYKTIDADFINDIAVKDGFLYVCGFNNRKNNGVPVQVAFILKFKYSGNSLTQVDKLYGYDSALLGSDMADSRLYRLHIQGNSLYVLGESAGGNSIFRWNGRDLKTETWKHSDAYNYPGVGKVRDAHILYYGVVNLETFAVEKGQFSIPRIPKDLVSNTNRARSIFADDENIYLGSEAAYGIEGREVFKFLSKNAPAYRGDAALLKVGKDLKARKYWFTPGNGQVLFHNGQYAVIRTDNVGDLATNQGTIDKAIASNTYLIVW